MDIFEFLFGYKWFWNCVEVRFQQYEPFFRSLAVFVIFIDFTFLKWLTLTAIFLQIESYDRARDYRIQKFRPLSAGRFKKLNRFQLQNDQKSNLTQVMIYLFQIPKTILIILKCIIRNSNINISLNYFQESYGFSLRRYLDLDLRLVNDYQICCII